jgi:hypothetical protein
LNELVTIRVDGTTAEGRFLCRSANTIEIEITRPYSGFSMSFELVSFDRAQGPQGLLGDEGMRSASYLLKTLYQVCRHLDENDEVLAAAYEEYRQLHHEIVAGGDRISDHFLVMVIEDLRERRDRGEIDRQEYERELTGYRVAHSRHHERLYHLRTEFFRMNFGAEQGSPPSPFESALGRSLEHQVLEYLRRRRIDPDRARIRRCEPPGDRPAEDPGEPPT